MPFGKQLSATASATSLALICALVFIQACGDKKKTSTTPPPALNPASDDAVGQPKHSEWVATETELPNCSADDEGKLAWVADAKKLFLCHGGSWTLIATDGASGVASGGSQGPNSGQNASPTSTASPAPAAPLAFLVVDGAGKTIGRTDFTGYLKSLDQSAFSFQFSDGGIFKVNPTNGGFSGEQCVYDAADCSGACLYPATAAQKNKIIQGASGFYLIAGTESPGTKSYNAYTLGDFPAPLCTALGGPQSGTLAEMGSAYTFADGITYPLAAPISVKPE